MELTLSVTIDGKEQTVRTRLAHLVEYERSSGRTVTSWSESLPGVTDLATLAWITVNANPRPPFEQWLETVDAVELVDIGSGDPTNPEASDASSRKRPSRSG